MTTSPHPTRLSVLAFEGFYGGSHKAFLDGLVGASRHDWRLVTLPAHSWRQRMVSGAQQLAEMAAPLASNSPAPDAIFATDMLDLSRLSQLLPERLACLPMILYFHENQLTYPIRSESGDPARFGLINAASALAADRVVFNSEFHRRDFLEALARLPAPSQSTPRPVDVAESIEARCAVIHPGIDIAGLPCPPRTGQQGPLVILWNHRWEHDKRPEVFFSALDALASRGVDFRAIVCGESFTRQPPVFARAAERLGARLEHIGFAPCRDEYAKLLTQADVVVSTAGQEFFGIAWLEACAAGCMPLLPRRLSYPELLPPKLHARCLYDSDGALPARLAELAASAAAVRADCHTWRSIAERFAWPGQAELMDRLLEELVAERASRT